MTPRRIKAGLITGVTLLLLCGFVVTNVVSYHVSKNAIRKGILNDTLPLVSDNVYSEIQRDLISPVEVSSLMANDTFLKEWIVGGEKDLTRIRNYLQAIKEKYGYVSTFFVSEKTRKYYHFKGLHKQIDPDDDHDVWYYRFRDLNVDYVLDVDTDETAQGRLTVFINHRLADKEGRFLGVAGVGISMGQIGTMLTEYRRRYGTTVFLSNVKGLIRAHPDPALIEKQVLSYLPGLAEKRKGLLDPTRPYTTIEYDHEGRHSILSVRYIPEFDWFLMVEQVEDTVLADIRANFYRNLAVGVVVTIVVLGITFLLVNFFQGKLEQVADELMDKNRMLETALGEVKQLSGLLPICAHCKKIRDDKGYWNQIESYIQAHSDAQFSHGICHECSQRLYSELADTSPEPQPDTGPDTTALPD